MDKNIYFLRLAKEVSKASKCLSRKIGSVLVKDGTIISTGYNGPPRGVKHCDERTIEFFEALDNQRSRIRVLAENGVCPRRYMGYKSGEGLHLCSASHSERNAILQAARNGISTLNTEIYCYCTLPCLQCSVEIINSGIKKIICLEGNDYDKYSRIILTETNIEIVQIDKELIDAA